MLVNVGEHFNVFCEVTNDAILGGGWQRQLRTAPVDHAAGALNIAQDMAAQTFIHSARIGLVQALVDRTQLLRQARRAAGNLVEGAPFDLGRLANFLGIKLRSGIAPCRGDSTLRLSGAALLHIPTGPLDALSEAYQSGAVVDVDAGFAGIFVEIKRR